MLKLKAMEAGMLEYKRIVLKLSGEALAGKAGVGLDDDTVDEICRSIRSLHEMGYEMASAGEISGAVEPQAPSNGHSRIIWGCSER